MKALLLTPDGVGVRNFCLGNLPDIALESKNNCIIWGEEKLLQLIDREGLEKVMLPDLTSSAPLMEIYRKTWQEATLKYLSEALHDPVYLSYIPVSRYPGWKGFIKKTAVHLLKSGKTTPGAIHKLKLRYLQLSRKTAYYAACKKQLEEIEPDVVFCTHQRAVNAIAPLLAARDLGIPTASFIYSWDNLPKATLFVDADHYLVWSDHMKAEMTLYHPDIAPGRVHVTGTPQFEPFSDHSLYLPREAFCSRYNIDPQKELICFTGDDAVTSPRDEKYLDDLSEAVNAFNRENGDRYRILFRRCPADWSQRYDQVLKRHENLIYTVDPAWTTLEVSGGWHQYAPCEEDISLYVNTVLHAALTVNIGSTTAMDFATMGKPACYLRYNTPGTGTWDIEKVYRYIHFRSMEGLDPVFWIRDNHEIPAILAAVDTEGARKVEAAKSWHRKIALHPFENSSRRIWQVLEKIAHR